MSHLQTERNALQYWERKRLIYNAVLAAIVLLGFALGLPHSWSWFSPPASSALFQAAIVANFLYCAAYLAEWLIVISPLRPYLGRGRRFVFVAGVLISVPPTLFIVVIIGIGPMSN